MRICQDCGRGSRMSVTRSHSNIATKHRQFVNLQSKKIDGKRMRICANCIKTRAKPARAAA